MYTLFCKWIWKKKLNFLKIEDNLKFLKLEKLPHFFENGRPQLFKNGRIFFSSNERPHFLKISYQMEYELDILANGRHPPRLKKQKTT